MKLSVIVVLASALSGAAMAQVRLDNGTVMPGRLGRYTPPSVEIVSSNGTVTIHPLDLHPSEISKLPDRRFTNLMANVFTIYGAFMNQNRTVKLQLNALSNRLEQAVQSTTKTVSPDRPTTLTKARTTSQPLASFSGAGTLTTRPFTAAGPWSLDWSSNGDFFMIAIKNRAGDVVAVCHATSGARHGETYHPAAGSFFLDVAATGGWHVTVRDSN